LGRFHSCTHLDPRSLACLRIGTAAVLAWDMLLALAVADDWWAMQGYGEVKLPAWTVLGSEAMTLQLAAIVVIACTTLLALGWRTGHVTTVAWISSCAFQYAARATTDYHNAVLCVLLFWSLALPTATVASMDARAGRQSNLPGWLVGAGCTGLLASLAWIYLSTAAAKSGAAWWHEGSAVWLALLDRGTTTAAGRWLALAAPEQIWPSVTWTALVLEWTAPVLLIWRRSRVVAVFGLVLFHVITWLLLDLGSFPLTMLVALAALLPASVWDRIGWRLSASAPVTCRRSGTRPQLQLVMMALALVITLEGERVVVWEGDTLWPYRGARHVARLRYLLGMEVVWGMYAPEPFRKAGWWVAVGWRADGTVEDPITGSAPTLKPPQLSGRGARLRWLALSDAPYETHGWGVQHMYRNFLLTQRNGTGPRQLQRLALVWVHEPLTPFTVPTHREPLLVLSWPEHEVSPAAVEQVLGVPMQAPLYDEDSGVLLGSASSALSSSAQTLP
jgi:hypothetical protein